MRTLLLSLSLFVSVSSFAQLGEGFYRVQNFKTERTLFVQDNKSKGIDYSALTADMAGIVPWSIFGREYITDPQSVIYIKKIEGEDLYNFYAQGVNTYEMLGALPIMVTPFGNGTYQCCAEQNGFTLRLCDENNILSEPDGGLGTNAPKKPGTNDPDPAYQRWYVRQVTPDSPDSYFGLKPTVSVDGKYYLSFYAMFSFKLHSPGMKAYLIDKYLDDMVVLKEFTEPIIPLGLPVIIECASANPSDNRLELVGVDAAAYSYHNYLTGNLFCFKENAIDSHFHKNVTEYNPNSMRLLGVTAKGRLGMVKTATDGLIQGKLNQQPAYFLPANIAYLKDESPTVAEQINFVSEEEFEKAVAIKTVKSEETAQQVAVYDATGKHIGNFASKEAAQRSLQKGLYIINNKKVVF